METGCLGSCLLRAHNRNFLLVPQAFLVRTRRSVSYFHLALARYGNSSPRLGLSHLLHSLQLPRGSNDQGRYQDSPWRFVPKWTPHSWKGQAECRTRRFGSLARSRTGLRFSDRRRFWGNRSFGSMDREYILLARGRSCTVVLRR